MRRYILVIVLTSMIYMVGVPGKGLAKDTVTWLTTHWPPIMTLDQRSRDISGGQIGAQLIMLQSDLAGYEHINSEMKWNRFWRIVKRGDHVCNCMAYKTREREDFTEFSIPITVVLPNHVIMRQKTVKTLGNPNHISLTQLMYMDNVSGFLIENRSYSHDIDSLLKKYEANSNIIRGVVNEQQYIKLMYTKRADYILEYPYVLNHAVDTYFKDYDERLTAIPIKESAPYYYVYVACPKNAWGKTIIGHINTALKRLRKTDAFRNTLRVMYTEEQLKTVWRYYDDHLLSETDEAVP